MHTHSLRPLAALALALASAQAVAACPTFPTDLGTSASVAVSGDTCGLGNDDAPTCQGTSTAEDAGFTWTAPYSGTFTFSTDGSAFDTTLQVGTEASCGATVVECDDDDGIGLQSTITLAVTGGEIYTISIDGYNIACGDYVLSIEDADIDGDGIPNAEDVCPEDAANPDADADGVCDDVDACPLDNPNDSDDDGVCESDDICTGLEDSADYDLGPVTGSNLALIDTCDFADNWFPSCAFGGLSTASDVSLTWEAPGAGAYRIDALDADYDVVLHTRSAAFCTDTELACSDDLGNGVRTTVLDVAPGAGNKILVVLDGYGTGCGAVTLNITDCDADNNGACDTVACFGDPASGNDDADALCNDEDLCPVDADDDSDFDGSCDSVDLCTGDDASGDTDSDGICNDEDFNLAMGAVIPGRDVTFTVTNAEPNARLWVVVSRTGPGPTCAPGFPVCSAIDVEASFEGPRTNANGRAVFSIRVPRALSSGTPIAFEAIWVKAGAGDASNVVLTTVQ